MLIDESTLTRAHLDRKAFEKRIVKEGALLWKNQQEDLRTKKLKEQQELREMLENYYPFGHCNDMKPRGLRNLRLEGLFPNKDFLNAKRFVGTLDLGRPGGGAPLVTDTGKKLTRTREDPLLRFQFGSHDLRRCVDNTLRYKTNREAQLKYKNELDKLVEEKKKVAAKHKSDEKEFYRKQFLKSPPWGKRGPGGRPWRNPNAIGLYFNKSLGWSNDETLKETREKLNELKERKPVNKVRKLEPVFYPCKNVYVGKKTRKLSPLPDGKENGVELVPLIAKQRRVPANYHLETTDVTNDKKKFLSSLWNRQGSAYLKELNQQVSNKQQKFKAMQVEEDGIVQRHFSTWNGFWGKPGHGAPKSAIRMQRLDRLLYPQMAPIGVH